METLVEVVDGNGVKGLDLIQYEEVMLAKNYVAQYPNGSIADHLKQIKDMPLSEGDVMLCSYLKTGTHWATNLISLILYNGPIEESPSVMPRCLSVFSVEDICALPSPKVFNSHFMYGRMPAEASKCKVVLIARNPKDTAVSLYFYLQKHQVYQLKQSWNQFQSTFLTGPLPCGPYTDYLKSFEKAIHKKKGVDICVVYYENLKQKGLEEMRKLQKHLGYNHSDDRLQAILDRCSLQRLKDDIKEGRTETNLRDSNGDPFVFRKGEVGDWRNYFTVAQSEAFDVDWKRQMKNSTFHFRYT